MQRIRAELGTLQARAVPEVVEFGKYVDLLVVR